MAIVSPNGHNENSTVMSRKSGRDNMFASAVQSDKNVQVELHLLENECIRQPMLSRAKTPTAPQGDKLGKQQRHTEQ